MTLKVDFEARPEKGATLIANDAAELIFIERLNGMHLLPVNSTVGRLVSI